MALNLLTQDQCLNAVSSFKQLGKQEKHWHLHFAARALLITIGFVVWRLSKRSTGVDDTLLDLIRHSTVSAELSGDGLTFKPFPDGETYDGYRRHTVVRRPSQKSTDRLRTVLHCMASACRRCMLSRFVPVELRYHQTQPRNLATLPW